MPSPIAPAAPKSLDLTSARYDLPPEAIDAYTQRVKTILHQDPMSMARGFTPVRENDLISDDQRAQLEAATKELLMSLPAGALAPGLVDQLESATGGRTFEGRTLGETPLRDLGEVGQAIAKDFLATLKHETPSAYYALAAAGAGAIGYVAWNKGSEGLEKLGIKPEAKLKLFGDKLAVKGGVDFDPHFKNPSVKGTVTSSFDVAPGARVSGQATFGKDGFDGASLSASYAQDAWRLSGQANFNRDGFNSASLVASYSRDPWAVNGAVTVDSTGRTTASVEADWRPKKNVELGISASRDSKGDSRVGVGLKVLF